MIRRSAIYFAAIFAIALVSASNSPAEIYRYIDASGEVHLVDDLSLVPAEYQQQSQRDAETRHGGGSLNVLHNDGSQTSGSSAHPAPVTRTAPAAQDPGPTRGQHDESWWRGQSQSKQRKIDALSKQLEQLKADEEDESLIYARPGRRGARGPAHAGRGRGNRAERAAILSDSDDDDDDSVTVEDLEAALEAAEGDLSDFEDRARRADVPPGWLR